MTEIEKELKRFIASGKATKKDNSGGFLTTYIDPLKIAKHFAEWQREQMMKDAAEGQFDYNHIIVPYSELARVFPNGKDGDKVKVIIIKE